MAEPGQGSRLEVAGGVVGVGGEQVAFRAEVDAEAGKRARHR
jgi:hypothetical protein